MKRFCCALAFLFGILLMPPAMRAQIHEVGDGGPGPAKSDHLTAELVTLSPDVPAGGHTTIGLSLTMEKHWHVYFANAGDSGEPPTIRWTLPNGITAGALRFDPPSRLPLGPFMDFGYEEQVAFPIEVSASRTLHPGKVHLDAHVNWLVCAQVCVPGKAHLGLDLNVLAPGASVSAPQLVGALGTAIKLLPQPVLPPLSVSVTADKAEIVVDLHTGKRFSDAELYPYPDPAQPDAPSLMVNTVDQNTSPLPDGIRIRLQRPDPAPTLPATLHGLIKIDDNTSYEFTAPLHVGAVPADDGDAPLTGTSTDSSGITIFGYLGLAFLGGIILNLMPCVFPVLFLKGLALVNSAQHEGETARRDHLRHGLVYTLGILVTFWTVVGVLLALRTTGAKLGWGFQLQSPSFVAILAAMLFLLGLSLAGQFEIGLSLTSTGDALTRKEGYAGSFFTGVLATVVATPCTAPLMGAAIGFALAQPAWLTFLIFTAIALGLALPYVALTAQPGWTKFLPKPGAWMEVLKQLTAVPIFATVIWLTWVYGQLYAGEGVDRIFRLLACFLVLAIAGWALGRWPARRGATITAVALIAVALFLPLHRNSVSRLEWKPWSPEAFTAARSSGHPVFIDYTAGWCLSCKFNEATVLNSNEVISQFAAGHVVLLRADWTKYDPAITESLSNVGRSGVPTYVIYPPGERSNADVLPEVLSRSLVLTALDRDKKPLGSK